VSMPYKLTTSAACRVARVDRDRFNEHVAAGRFPCAPETVPGRARLFDPDDMIALCLFRELMDDGLDATRSGRIACAVAEAARRNPDEPFIAYVEYYVGKIGDTAFPEQVLDATKRGYLRRGLPIRKVTSFNVGKLRELIASGTDEERSIVGEND